MFGNIPRAKTPRRKVIEAKPFVVNFPFLTWCLCAFARDNHFFESRFVRR